MAIFTQHLEQEIQTTVIGAWILTWCLIGARLLFEIRRAVTTALAAG